jgi:hypothetical protein
VDPSRLVVLDETWVKTNMAPRRRWEPRGRCLIGKAPHGQRTKSAYIFGAICLRKGKGAGLITLRCNTSAMQARLARINAMVYPGAHAF